MPLQMIMNEIAGNGLRTIALEGSGFKRIVIVVDKDDTIKYENPNNDDNQVSIVLVKGAMNPNANAGQS